MCAVEGGFFVLLGGVAVDMNFEFEGQSEADGTVAGEQYRFLQDCEPLAVLLGHYAEDRWATSYSHCDLGRVSPLLLLNPLTRTDTVI